MGKKKKTGAKTSGKDLKQYGGPVAGFAESQANGAESPGK